MSALVTGRWMTPNAVPINGAVFTVQRYSAVPVSVLSDPETITSEADGTFEMPMEAGSYVVNGPNSGGSVLIKVPASTGTFTFSSLIVPNS